ncbi:hypothetical protein [Archangium violaceum]|uniref:hypothetical protein n=1 Tax=Archangium violaceum TaxID=83451 RepID=UPI0037C11AF0
MERFWRTCFRLTSCHKATLGRRDFYRQLCLALGLSPKATAAVFYSVTGQVQELASARVHPVFLLDEAHLLHSDVLAHRTYCSTTSGTAVPCSASSSSACPSSRIGSP